jgi:hypothetical protein
VPRFWGSCARPPSNPQASISTEKCEGVMIQANLSDRVITRFHFHGIIIRGRVILRHSLVPPPFDHYIAERGETWVVKRPAALNQSLIGYCPHGNARCSKIVASAALFFPILSLESSRKGYSSALADRHQYCKSIVDVWTRGTSCRKTLMVDCPLYFRLLRKWDLWVGRLRIFEKNDRPALVALLGSRIATPFLAITCCLVLV